MTYPTLRPLYLDWIISKNNLPLARAVFANVSQIPPYNIELFRKMISMERSQKTIDVAIVRQLYEMACLYFGSTHSGKFPALKSGFLYDSAVLFDERLSTTLSSSFERKKAQIKGF